LPGLGDPTQGDEVDPDRLVRIPPVPVPDHIAQRLIHRQRDLPARLFREQQPPGHPRHHLAHPAQIERVAEHLDADLRALGGHAEPAHAPSPSPATPPAAPSRPLASPARGSSSLGCWRPKPALYQAPPRSVAAWRSASGAAKSYPWVSPVIRSRP